MESTARRGVQATENTEDNGHNEERAEFTLFDVFDVSFDVLLVTPSIVLVVVSGSTLRAWKTTTLSLKRSKSPTLMVPEGTTEPNVEEHRQVPLLCQGRHL
jgi:hypothetical protein